MEQDVELCKAGVGKDVKRLQGVLKTSNKEIGG
jgi:hypothetical protein